MASFWLPGGAGTWRTAHSNNRTIRPVREGATRRCGGRHPPCDQQASQPQPPELDVTPNIQFLARCITIYLLSTPIPSGSVASAVRESHHLTRPVALPNALSAPSSFNLAAWLLLAPFAVVLCCHWPQNLASKSTQPTGLSLDLSILMLDSFTTFPEWVIRRFTMYRCAKMASLTTWMDCITVPAAFGVVPRHKSLQLPHLLGRLLMHG
jgi:hypothetical protein